MHSRAASARCPGAAVVVTELAVCDERDERDVAMGHHRVRRRQRFQFELRTALPWPPAWLPLGAPCARARSEPRARPRPPAQSELIALVEVLLVHESHAETPTGARNPVLIATCRRLNSLTGYSATPAGHRILPSEKWLSPFRITRSDRYADVRRR